MNKQWWHNKIAYQIYPKSFYDSNGDGIGDIGGIRSKLGYLERLGIDILWISPMYTSPLADEGYDIADYYSIDPRFGTMEEMDLLIDEARAAGISILMDLVVNHTSDEHRYFLDVKTHPESPYKDWYILRKKNADGSLPTNWRSYFGGSVWEELGYDDLYYLHMFHKKQPDLNWENKDVREAVYKNINFWLDKGLGGFRIDAIINIKKPEIYKDYTPDRKDGLASGFKMLEDATGIGIFLNEMKEKCFLPHNAFTVGEVFNIEKKDVPDFIGPDGYFNSMFDFSSAIEGQSEKGWYDYKEVGPQNYKKAVFTSQKTVGDTGFLSNIIENHDEPRGVSHYLPKADLCEKSKKLLATLFFFLRGIPFIYQGQEIGMENISYSDPSQISDISAQNEYQVALDAGYSVKDALEIVSRYSRDNSRTPMQWTDKPNAGFTTGTPWLFVNENYKDINVSEQESRSDSVLAYYKAMIRLRKDPDLSDLFTYGDFSPFMENEDLLMAYTRTFKDRQVLIAGNFSHEEKVLSLPCAARLLLANDSITLNEDRITLKPFDAAVIIFN